MSDASIAASNNGIVVEVLTRENYANWSTLVENYLKGNDLWDNVIENDHQNDDVKKNRRALHAIQLSCGGKALGQIRKCTRAREAWDRLKTAFGEVEAYYEGEGSGSGSKPKEFFDEYDDERTAASPLQICVRKGFLDDAEFIISCSPSEIFFASPEDGRTVLHVAVAVGHAEIVKKLVKAGKQRLLKMRDKKGYTALALAAKLTDNKDIAEWIVNNGGEELLTITSKEEDAGVDEIPVLLASAKGHKQMTKYLFAQTPWSVLCQNDWQYGVVLLSRCIYNEIFDVAVAILQHHDARGMPLFHRAKHLRPVYALACKPSAFPRTGTKLNWQKRFIYNILRLETHIDFHSERIKRIEIVSHELDEIERPNIMTHTLPGRLFGRFQQFVQTSVLLKVDVFKKIYDEKTDHYLVVEILNRLCKRISTMPEEELRKASAYDAMLQASKNGITEFIESMSGANPELLLAKDQSKRGIFAHAILNRQEEVFQLIHDIENKDIFTSKNDVLGNNLLHIAAELGPSCYLDRISNAALQMQRELQWFQGVKRIVPQRCHEAEDANGKMASELFTEDHKELLKSGQQWAKDTASSFTLVGTLIITIMFAAAFTVPGGNNGDNGVPVFLGKNIFTFFIISDAISLVTSSSSVLVFIGILTSRNNEEDFNRSLPLKLLFGLLTLFLSVASMMCSFCAALALVLKGYRRIVMAAMWLALLPILVFVPTLLRLVSEISQSTIRFHKLAEKKKRKQDYYS